jgi:hypothetical protein
VETRKASQPLPLDLNAVIPAFSLIEPSEIVLVDELNKHTVQTIAFRSDDVQHRSAFAVALASSGFLMESALESSDQYGIRLAEPCGFSGELFFIDQTTVRNDCGHDW